MQQTRNVPFSDEPSLKTAKVDSAAFLLAEYDRLRDVREELHQRASRRFEFYVTISSAAVGAFLLVGQSQAGTRIPEYIYDLVAIGLLGYGGITFLNLTFASTFQFQLLRAFREIQRYFLERDPDLAEYLYFNSPGPPSDSYRLARVLRRGMGGGSEKSVIAFFNSGLAAYLLISLGRRLGVQLQELEILIIAVIAFVVFGVAHGVYVSFAYRFAKAGQD